MRSKKRIIGCEEKIGIDQLGIYEADKKRAGVMNMIEV